MPNYAPTLTVDLSAIVSNYKLLAARVEPSNAQCAAVVKADAYGLGMARVAPALAEAGCKQFFVATLEEGTALRKILPQASIAVFHGPYANEEADYLAHTLTPVLNSPDQIERWAKAVINYPHATSILHVDTGMCRLGLSERELDKLMAAPKLMAACRLSLLMSHLACANEPEHPKNAEQMIRFLHAKSLLPHLNASLANSSGIFLNTHFHFDLARPGCALYGINPTEGPNPMRPVAYLRAPILQIRELDRDETVGYGASVALMAGAKVAIIQLGYADGYLRHLSNIGKAFLAGREVAVLGRVSMDMIALDASMLSDEQLAQATHAELLNDKITVNEVARAAGTIGYEIFTRIGARVRREYNDIG